MDNKENELFNGIIDIPQEQSNTENSMPNINENLEYNFNFESQVESNFNSSNDYIPNNQTYPAENMSSVASMPESQTPEVLSIPTVYLNSENSMPIIDSITSVESTPVVEFSSVDQPSEIFSQAEVVDFSNDVLESQAVNTENSLEEKKQVNEELLKNLTADTNDFVNPSLIVDPSVKAIEAQPELIDEEPSVNYTEINNKKKYIFMIILFGIIILFVMFLPTIVSLIGF